MICETDRFGFAYGTLQSHPEQGEEAFVVSNDEGSVTFEISAFSRPADPIARFASSLTRKIQRRVTHKYLSGLAEYVTRAD